MSNELTLLTTQKNQNTFLFGFVEEFNERNFQISRAVMSGVTV